MKKKAASEQKDAYAQLQMFRSKVLAALRLTRKIKADVDKILTQSETKGIQ